jgi:acyl-CoA thioester hydrolase
MIDLPVRHAFVMHLTVEARDIDPQGHASNVAVLSWMNAAAWEHSDALGWDVAAYQRVGGWFVVRRHEIDYHHRAVAGEKLLCYTWPSAIGKVSAERRHYIVRAEDSAMIAEGFNIWAFVDAKTFKPKRIPAAVAEAFDPAKFE